jgi:hypothetical protein
MEPFLDESQTFMRSMTESFHLINTSRAGADVLAEQVNKLAGAGASDTVIEALFPMPPGTTGQNIRAHTFRPRDEKDRDLAIMWLLVVIARYETWAETLEEEHGIVGGKRAAQFPDNPNGTQGHITVLRQHGPDVYMTEIYGAAVQSDRYWISTDAAALDALKLYRYFKEVRNALAHSDGRARPRLATASQNAVAAASRLMISTTLRPSTVVLYNPGDPVAVTFELVRDAIALMQRLVFTIDAHVLLSARGRAQLLQRWKQHHGEKPVRVLLKKLETPGWYAYNVSQGLSFPVPPSSEGVGKTWPKPARDSFHRLAMEEWLIRRHT